MLAWLAVLTVPVAVAGFALFLYGAFLAFRHGLGGGGAASPLPTGDDHLFTLQWRRPGPGRRAASWARIKELVRQESWRRNPQDRAFLAMIAGGMTAVFGSFLSIAVLTGELGMVVIVLFIAALFAYAIRRG